MTNHTIESSPQAYARIGGWLYLIVIVGGLFSEAYVRGGLVVYGDAAATARNILADEQLYRWGFAAGIVLGVCNVPLALIFYGLFKRVNATLAWLVATFILVGAAIETVNLLAHFAPLIVLKGAQYASVFSQEQLQALAHMSLRMFAVGFGLCLVFFAFYDLAIGYLIFKSTFLPKVFGVLMAIAGVCYLTNSFVTFLAPPLSNYLFPWILIPCFVAEASLCLRLIVFGVNVRNWEDAGGIATRKAS